MNNVICVTSANSIGCTFLDWSIHFLSGQQDFYHCKSQSLIPLSQNPIKQLNAHGHKKNHPAGLDSTARMHQHLLSLPQARFYSMYPIMPLDTAINRSGYSLEQYAQTEIQQQIADECLAEFCNIINYLLDNDSPVIVIEQNAKLQVYTSMIRQLDRRLMQDKPVETYQQLMNEQNSIYFQSSVDTWQDLGLTNIWDQRERDALNIRPFNKSNFVCNFNRPICRIDSLELWGFGPQVVHKVMNFLQLGIDANRLDNWHQVYRSWQKNQFDILEFAINLDYIVDAIVNNWYYQLPKLTYQQEVIIQHCLIYQHGLNLKTWQLEKFPSNAQQLHVLLEANTHPVEKIYS